MKPHHPSRSFKPASQGFTLVELLLVLVILGTLAAIVIPRMSGRAEQAKFTAAGTDISNISNALTLYEVDNGGYPSTSEGLEALIIAPQSATAWRGPYLQTDKVPADPWNNAYVYEKPGQHRADFDLFSMGPDGKEGGDDDVTNWTQ